ncbi:MAG: glutathione S-transferase family protein [Burkholderiaceae bacterium]
MIQVYSIPTSLYCAKLRIVLRHKGLPFEELPPPGGYGTAKYRELVPSGNLPALLDGNLMIADSEAAAEYLEELQPDPPMLPDTPAARAKAREWSRFHDTRLEPQLRALFGQVGAASPDRTLISKQSKALIERMSQMARMAPGRDALGYQQLMLGDCGYPITFAWMEALDEPLGLNLVWPQAVTQYRQEISQNPTVAAELKSYREALGAWLSSKAPSR